MIDTNSSIIIIEQIDLGERNEKNILLYWCTHGINISYNIL